MFSLTFKQALKKVFCCVLGEREEKDWSLIHTNIDILVLNLRDNMFGNHMHTGLLGIIISDKKALLSSSTKTYNAQATKQL